MIIQFINCRLSSLLLHLVAMFTKTVHLLFVIVSYYPVGIFKYSFDLWSLCFTFHCLPCQVFKLSIIVIKIAVISIVQVIIIILVIIIIIMIAITTWAGSVSACVWWILGKSGQWNDKKFRTSVNNREFWSAAWLSLTMVSQNDTIQMLALFEPAILFGCFSSDRE